MSTPGVAAAGSFADLPITRCRSCDAKSRWVTMESGKAMLIDPYPHHAGNIARLADGRGTVTNDAPPGQPLYRSHFASCPDADKHRRPRSRA